MAEYSAFGTILAVGNGESPSEEFMKIAQVKDISGPSMSRETIDVTNHQSPGGFSEFLASLADGGEVTFTVEYDPEDASHDQTTGLLFLMGLTTRRNWRLIFPVPAVNSGEYVGYAFVGLVTGFSPSAAVKGSLTADVTIKVAGAITQGAYATASLC
jgi:predicted secreted protein